MRITREIEQFFSELEVARRRDRVRVLHSRFGRQSPLEIAYFSFFHLDLAQDNRDPSLAPAAKLQRQFDTDSLIVVGTANSLCSARFEHRVRLQSGLAQTPERLSDHPPRRQ